MKWLLYMCLCAYVFLGSNGQESIYNAKVVDYTFISDNTPEEIIKANIRNVVAELEKYSSPPTDVLVFPEYAITGFNIFSHNNLSKYAVPIPPVDLQRDLCRNNNVHQVIQDVACAMAQSNAPEYLVLNLLEQDIFDIYNTNVVFRKGNGTIIAKYRKINLNQETEKGRLTAGVEAVTFEVESHKARFGLLISDDIFHKSPAEDILSEANVTNVIITSAWRSEFPFYSGVGLHSGYAKRHGVNLLAASLSDPETGRGGSGIYAPGVPDQVYIPSVQGVKIQAGPVKVLLRRRPEAVCSRLIQPRGLGIGGLPSIDSFKTRVIKNLDAFTIKPVLRTENNYLFVEKICSGKMCCRFEINYKSDLFSLQPVYKVAVADFACGLIACDSADDINTCGSRHDDLKQGTFNNITITVTVSDKKRFHYQPVASNIVLKSIDYTFCDNSEDIVMTAVSPTDVSYMGVIMDGFNGAQTLAGVGFLGLITIIMTLCNLM